MLDCVGFLILQDFSCLFFWVDFVSTHTLPLLFLSYLPFLLLYKCLDRHILRNVGLLRIFIIVRYWNLNRVKTNSVFLQKKIQSSIGKFKFPINYFFTILLPGQWAESQRYKSIFAIVGWIEITLILIFFLSLSMF